MKIFFAIVLGLIYFLVMGLLIWKFIIPLFFSLLLNLLTWEVAVSIVCLISIYAILIILTRKIKLGLRTYIIAGYASIHLLSWILMDIPVRHEFKHMVRKMHQEALADKESNHHVFPTLSDSSISVKSIAPIPFVLVTTQLYQIGPFWGLGEVYIYIFNGRAIKVVLKEMYYVS
jgi:hypothetical protein